MATSVRHNTLMNELCFILRYWKKSSDFFQYIGKIGNWSSQSCSIKNKLIYGDDGTVDAIDTIITRLRNACMVKIDKYSKKNNERYKYIMNNIMTNIVLCIGYTSLTCMLIFIVLDLFDHKQLYNYIIIGCLGICVGVLVLAFMCDE